MERALILLFTTVLLFGAPGINANLSFASDKEFKITRTGCGDTKLCVETPAKCDPAGSSACLFGSVKGGTPMPPTGAEMTFELSGNSSGFIALGLTQNASQGNTMLFACAKKSSVSFLFQTLTRNNANNNVISADMPVRGIRGKVNGDVVQCEFKVPNLNASSTRNANDTTFVILLGSGTVNGDTFGNFMVFNTTQPLNLASGAERALHPHAVQLLLSMLTLSVLKIA